MASSNPSLENEIVQWLVELIESDELPQVIEGVEGIEKIVESFDQESIISAFGIDHLSRRASARAADIVLGNLGLLEVIAVDKSISLTKGEVLRPDILCFNPETQTFVVFEVKRDKLTERQAVTELAGYEQELRNALPFLGDYNINFVVVSTQWDPLLDHAIANLNTWSSKYCLALEVVTGIRPFRVTCRLPEAWHLRGGVGLPDEALRTIDVYLYEEESDSQEEDVPQTLVTATNAIARAGDRFGSHGFVMLWRDHSNLGNGQWSWTLCGIDPIAMYSWCSRQGLQIRESKLTEYLDRKMDDTSQQVPEAVFKIAKESFPILRNRYRPGFEADFSWNEKLSIIRRRATPVYFEFWGAFGDYAREFVSNPGVRERYMPFIDQNEVDWCAPVVALPLLGNICGDIPFPDGLVRCSDAFQAGVKLGLREALASIAQSSENENRKLAPLLEWSFLEVLRVAIEMGELYRTAKELDQPPPALSNLPERRVSSTRELSAWVTNHLIGDEHPLHQMSFDIGRAGAPFFSDWLDPVEQDEFVQAHGENLAKLLRELLGAIVQEAKQFGGGIQSVPAVGRLLDRLEISANSDSDMLASAINLVPAVELLSVFRDDRGAALDEVVPAVFHTAAPLSGLVVDWDGLKKSVRSIYESGCCHPAIIVSQNGMLSVGKVDKRIAGLLIPIIDPGVEVYFVDTRAVSAIAAKMSWTRLQENFAQQEPS